MNLESSSQEMPSNYVNPLTQNKCTFQFVLFITHCSVTVLYSVPNWRSRSHHKFTRDGQAKQFVAPCAFVSASVHQAHLMQMQIVRTAVRRTFTLNT